MTVDEYLDQFGLSQNEAQMMLRNKGVPDFLICEFGRGNAFNFLNSTFAEDLRSRRQKPDFGPVVLISNNRARGEVGMGFLVQRSFPNTAEALNVVQNEWGSSTLKDGYISGKDMKTIWRWEDLEAYVERPRFPVV